MGTHVRRDTAGTFAALRARLFVETYLVADRQELLEQESLRLTVPERRLRTAVRGVSDRVHGPLAHPVDVRAADQRWDIPPTAEEGDRHEHE